MRPRALKVLTLLFLLPVPLSHLLLPVAARPAAPSPTGKVLDLVFRVEDIGGGVQTLQVQETPTEVHIDLPADILFDFDKDDILPKAQKALHQAAEIIQQRAKGTVRIEGHTDSKGAPAYNQSLSGRRAAAVKDWLVNKEGLRGVAFATAGYGASRPKVPNTKPDGSDDPKGRQQNRRVEIVITK